MATLELERNRFQDPDAAYQLIIAAHRGLSEEQSAALNARLVLILANQLGEEAALRQALETALSSMTVSPTARQD